MNPLEKKIEDPLKQYLKKRLHLKDEKEMGERIKAIKNNSYVEYYNKVQRYLPTVIDNAVTSAIAGPTNLNEISYEVLFEDSLKATERLMLFYRHGQS